MRIIITGGTGLIGRALAADLLQAKHEVIILSRNPGRPRSQALAGARLEKWDGRSAAGWGKLADGAGAIINLAGASIAEGRWTKQRKAEILESRLLAGQAVVEAVRAATRKPGVVIQASAIGYYGPRSDEEITEQAGSGHDFPAQVSVQWEQAVAPLKEMGVRLAIIRTGLVLSLEGGALPQLVRPFKMMAGGPMGSGEQWYSWIHLTDEVRAIRFLLEDPALAGVFNLTAPAPVINRVFANTLGLVMERPSLLPAPAIALKLALGEMSTIILDGQRVIPARLLEAGFRFRFSTLEHALRDILAQTQATVNA